MSVIVCACKHQIEKRTWVCTSYAQQCGCSTYNMLHFQKSTKLTFLFKPTDYNVGFSVSTGFVNETQHESPCMSCVCRVLCTHLIIFLVWHPSSIL